MHEVFQSHISFYFKASRIHVFIDALRGIGSPSRICFMLDGTGTKLMLLPYPKRDFKSHPVPKKVYSGSESMEINSLKLCRIISHLHKLDETKSFRFPGLVDVDDRVAVFDLSRPQVIHQFRGENRSSI